MNQNTLLNAAYLSNGLNEHPQIDNILDHWDGGHLELTAQLMRYAAFITALEEAAHAVTGDYPGVFQYELPETFGHWFGDQVLLTDEENMAPADGACLNWLRENVFAFFDTLNLTDDQRVALLKAVQDVPANLPEA